MKCNFVSLFIVYQTIRICFGKLIPDNIGGRLVYPPGRSSLWRFNYTNVPVNENDYKINCGGFQIHWLENNGRCGICGDPWKGSRDHEYGGKYFSGIISESYIQNTIINVSVEILQNLEGWFEFKLCPYKNVTNIITQTCLDNHTLEIGDTGRTKYRVKQNGIHILPLKLPTYAVCKRCLLQWRYHTGTRWGCDSADKCCKGCGSKQEEYYSCSDISIKPSHLTKTFKPIENENTRIQNCDISVYQRWWCRTQCVGDECRKSFCACLENSNRRIKRQTVEKICESIGVWANPGHTTWCQNNCNSPVPYCPSNICACKEPSSQTTTTTTTTTATTSITTPTTTPTTATTTSTTSRTQTTKSTTQTTKSSPTPPTSSTTNSQQTTTSSSSTTTEKSQTTVPYPTDALGIVKVMATFGCEYCSDKNNVTCTNLFCPGYDVTSTGISGSSLTEKVDTLTDYFCKTCDEEDSICQKLFCQNSESAPVMRDFGMAIKCSICTDIGDQVCLQDSACSPDTNGITTTTKRTTTKSTTAMISENNCTPKTDYAQISGITEWCNENFPNYGSTEICDCLGTAAIVSGNIVYEDGYICEGAGAYASNANMVDWCLANCANNNCPSTHCHCYPPPSSAAVTTTKVTPKPSTTANKEFTDYFSLNELTGLICKLSQTDQTTYLDSILRFCPAYNRDLTRPSDSTYNIILFTTDSFTTFSKKNIPELEYYTNGGINSPLASKITTAFCGGCQGVGGQNCTQYCQS